MKIVERLKRLMEVATPGKWWYNDSGKGHIAAPTDGFAFFSVASCIGKENADLCAAARNALPALLAVVEAAAWLRTVEKQRLDDHESGRGKGRTYDVLLWESARNQLDTALADLAKMEVE